MQSVSVLKLLLFISFLPLVQLWNAEYLQGILLPISRLSRLQELNWFLSEQLKASSAMEEIDDFINFMHKELELTQLVITNRSDIRLTKSDNRKNYMGVVFTTGPDDPIMLVHDRVTLGKHFYSNIIVMVPVVSDFAVIEQFLQDLVHRKFINSILHFSTTNGTTDLFGASIYPEYRVENRSNFVAFLKQNMAKLLAGGLDVRGREFSTPLAVDLPGVFPMAKGEYQGFAYRMLRSFMDYVNGTLKPYAMPKDSLGGGVINMADALQLVRESKVQFLAHAYALFAIDETIDKSYPIMVVKWCLMVPSWNSVSTLFYPVKPFTVEVWYGVVVCYVTLLLLDLLWLMLRPQDSCEDRRSFWCRLHAAFLHSYCLLFNISTGKTLFAPSLRRYLLSICIFFFGFFVSANYTSLLGSILTVTLFRGQINTMQDLINANLSVMIIDYELDFLLSAGNDLPAAFLRLLLPVDVAVFHAHQLAFNDSFAYFVTDNVWSFISLQQAHLKQGLFKLSDICFGSYHLAYPMVTDSPIWRNLEYYTFRVHSSGMLEHYEQITFDYALQAGYMRHFSESNEYTSASMEHLMIIFIAMLTFYAVAFVVFLMELLMGWNWNCCDGKLA